MKKYSIMRIAPTIAFYGGLIFIGTKLGWKIAVAILIIIVAKATDERLETIMRRDDNNN